MARTVSRGGARGVGAWAAFAAFVVAAVLLIVLLASREGSKPAEVARFPASQAVPVTIARPERIVGAGVIGWRLPVAFAAPRDVAITPAGTVWITEQNKGAVDALTNGKLIRYEIDAKFPDSGTFGLGEGPSDSMWFTGYPNGNIGRLLPDGTANSFSALVDASGTVAVAQALDRAMWITDVNLGVLIRISDLGGVAAYAVPPPAGTTQQVGPYDIARGSDGTLWFTDPRTRSVGTISYAAGTPTIVEYPILDGSDPRSIAAGQNGTMWVALPKVPGIGRVDAPGSVHTFRVDAAKDPLNDLAVADDGTIWLTTAGRDILHVRPDGTLIRRVAMPAGAVGADGIAVASDGTVWAAATDANMVVEIPNDVTG